MSLLTAATISGVSPGATARSTASSTASDSSQSRNAPTVIARNGAKAAVSCVSTISRVTSSSSYGISGVSRKVLSGSSARARLAATRSSALTAATPASASPERWGEALASSVARSSKR